MMRLLLVRRRKALGLTQEDLAKLLHVERSTVVRWERGQTEPLPWTQPKLAKALQVTADRLEKLLASGAPQHAAHPAREPAGTVPWPQCRSSRLRRRTMSPATPNWRH